MYIYLYILLHIYLVVIVDPDRVPIIVHHDLRVILGVVHDWFILCILVYLVVYDSG